MIRIIGSWQMLGYACHRILQLYGWTHIVIFTDNNSLGSCIYGATSIRDELQGSNITITEWIQAPFAPEPGDIRNYISRVRQRGRSQCLQQLAFFKSKHRYIGAFYGNFSNRIKLYKRLLGFSKNNSFSKNKIYFNIIASSVVVF